MHEPLVRARHLKSVLAAMDRLRERDAVRARLPASMPERVEAAHGSDWLPIEHDLAFARALHAVLGKRELDVFNRRMLVASFQGPLLRTLVQTAVELLGVDPGAWARWIPKGWRLVFRDCGTWTIDRIGPREVVLRLSDLPAVCAEDPVWPGSVGSSLSSILDLADARGDLALDSVDAAARTATYTMRWEPQRG
jgi:hypothetical protein